MTRSPRWAALALLCLLLFEALCSGVGLSADVAAVPPAGKATTPAPRHMLVDAPKPPPRPLVPEPERQVIQMQLKGQDDPAPKLGYGNCQWLYPLDSAPKKLREEPKYRSNKPVYYGARYGDAKDNLFTFVLDESGGPGKGYDVLYADVNNDNRIDSEKERFKLRLGTTSRDEPLRIHLLVTAGGVTAPYYVNFAAFPYSDEKSVVERIHANLRNSSYYEGVAVLLGRRHKIAIADLDSNGLFNDVEQGLFHGDRFFADLDDDSGARPGQMQSFPYGKYTRIAGTWYSIVASPGGARVEISLARPALGKIAAPLRVGSARLSSPTQPLDLKFTDGSDSAVAGEYRVQSVELLAEGESSGGRRLSGSFLGREPKVTVREGETTRLEAGLPLIVQPQVAVDEERTLRISLRINGAGGEIYRWSPQGGSSSKAGFEIVDASGKPVAAGEFEYG